jgi:hypothetical protein
MRHSGEPWTIGQNAATRGQDIARSRPQSTPDASRSIVRAIEVPGDAMHQVQKGSCFCGAVELMITGAPATAGFCHCSACRSWAATPVRKFSLWKSEAVKILKGEENVGVFHKTATIYRKFCRICGAHLMTSHPRRPSLDVYAATLPIHRHGPKVLAAAAATVSRNVDETILA